jgi:hypothetical protein
MFQSMQLLTTLLVAVAMVPAVAHALEFPGKMRLSRDAYLAVQPIYYPGFTIAGIVEAGGLIASIVLLVLTPPGTARFWLTLASAIGMVGMQIVLWVYTQPVNKVWLENTELGEVGSGFFALKAGRTPDQNIAKDWKQFRNQWERSHIVRAVLVFLSFFSLLLAIVFKS